MIHNVQANLYLCQHKLIQNIKNTGKKHEMNRLEKYLKHRSITQRGFAKSIGVTPNTLNSLIKGKSMPGLLLAYEIEIATGGLVTVYDWIPKYLEKTNRKTDVDI